MESNDAHLWLPTHWGISCTGCFCLFINSNRMASPNAGLFKRFGLISQWQRNFKANFFTACRRNLGRPLMRMGCKQTNVWHFIPVETPKWNMVAQRHFAGRQKGLKRRKSKKEAKRVQEALGRRLELFYPKKAKPARIRLVQNSRGNVIYDPVFRKFRVMYYKQGVQVFRSFGGRFELARCKAIAFAQQMADLYRNRLESSLKLHANQDPDSACEHTPLESNIINYKLKLQPDANLSGLGKTFFNDKIGCWVVAYKDAGVRKYREFNVHDLGFQQAYCQAVNFARYQLYYNHQFQIKRHRVRKNRCPLH